MSPRSAADLIPRPLRGLRTARRLTRWAQGAAAAVAVHGGGAPAAGAAPPGLRILTDTTFQQALPWAAVSAALATALRLRGHQITALHCDGLLPACELMLGRQPQPSCRLCAGAQSAVGQAFHLPTLSLTGLLTPRDRAEALAAVTRQAPGTLTALAVDAIPLGRLAARELQRYARGFIFDVEGDPAYRPWLISALLLDRLMDRALVRVQPDLVFATNGRILPAAILVARARQRGIRVVTWDTEPTHSDGLVFSHEGEAALVPLDAVWAEAANPPLTEDQQAALATFAEAWRLRHHPATGQVPAGLRDGHPCMVAFANAAWDTAALDRDVGFASMFDWLDQVVAHARAHPHVDVVVRSHPAERAGTPDLWSRTPVAATLRERSGPLPANLHLVDAADVVDTYALVERSTAVLVYSSRIGLEAALRGRRPWIAGATTYRGKGFSRDLAGAADLAAAFGLTSADRLTPGERARAERFAYLWWFRALVRLPWLRNEGREAGPPDMARLAPGGDVRIDRLCEAIATGAPFIDLGAPAAEERT